MRERRRQCEAADCRQLPPYENLNCVHRCISAACYDKVYAAEPVSDMLRCLWSSQVVIEHKRYV